MKDYEPLDISPSCNTGPDILGTGGANVEPGLKTFRGLPFMIGGQAENSFIAPTPNGDSLVVPVRKAARRVLFAHALLDSKLDRGGPLGEQVAEYVFHLSSGSQERVNIRERFEIAARPGFPPGTPGLPFRAVTDREAVLMPRFVGEFGEAGRRKIEAEQASVEMCWLWSWENPEPDSSIESVEIIPAGRRFFIAAITLGHLDEHPFAREGRRPAKITFSTKPTPRSRSTSTSKSTGATPLTPSLCPPCRQTNFSPPRIRGDRTPMNFRAPLTWKYPPHRRRP